MIIQPLADTDCDDMETLDLYSIEQIRDEQESRGDKPCFMTDLRYACTGVDCEWRRRCRRLVAEWRRQ